MLGNSQLFGRSLIGLMLGLAVLLMLEGAAFAATSVEVNDWRVCEGPPSAAGPVCSQKRIYDVDPQGRTLWLSADVELAASARGPMAVFVSAFASSRVYWNGRLVGSNGRPSATPERERPGLRDAAFPIGSAEPGVHKLVLQMSSHHGLLRLRSSVMRVRIAPYEAPLEPVLRDYLPALITAGGLLIAGMVFGFACWFGAWRASGKYLVAAALFATAQLIAETSRAFIPHLYPPHILRLSLILAFAAAFGFMLLAYLARRFEVPRLRTVLLVQGAAAAVIVVAVPSFDQKTGLVLSSALTIGILLAAIGTRRSAPGALPILVTLAVGLTLPLLDLSRFLDRDFYLLVLGLFVLLFADGARRLKHAPPAAMPASPDKPPGLGAPAGVSLGSGASRCFVLPADIVRLAAADDYTEVFLAGGGSVLHPEPLQRLLKRLPANFFRIHRSHAINLSHLRSFRKGSGSVLLSDHSTAPVSRRSVAKLLAAIGS